MLFLSPTKKKKAIPSRLEVVAKVSPVFNAGQSQSTWLHTRSCKSLGGICSSVVFCFFVFIKIFLKWGGKKPRMNGSRDGGEWDTWIHGAQASSVYSLRLTQIVQCLLLLCYMIFFYSKHSYVIFSQLRKSYGDVYSLFIGSRPAVVINGVKAMKEALVTKSSEFAGRPQDLFVNQPTQGKDRQDMKIYSADNV